MVTESLSIRRLPYREFLETSYEYLIEKSKKLEDPQYLEKSFLDKDKLEVLIIGTLMEIRKELGLEEDKELDAREQIR